MNEQVSRWDRHFSVEFMRIADYNDSNGRVPTRVTIKVLRRYYSDQSTADGSRNVAENKNVGSCHWFRILRHHVAPALSGHGLKETP